MEDKKNQYWQKRCFFYHYFVVSNIICLKSLVALKITTENSTIYSGILYYRRLNNRLYCGQLKV